MDRKTYIENNDDIEALKKYLEAIGEPSVKTETIAVEDAYNRVTAVAVYAKKCDPMYNASAMDGIAVIAESTSMASEANPISLHRGKDFEYINTGGAIEGLFNAVVMIEDVIKITDDVVKIVKAVYPWENVRVIGESIVGGEMVVPSRKKLTACDIGALIASGNVEVEVFAKPMVGIIPTGEEMIDNPDMLGTGKLMESNSKVFAALTMECGGIPKRYPVVSDSEQKLESAINKALKENDIVLINAGSSAGTKDFTVKVIEKLGKVVIHGIAIKPGKPTILGIVNGKPVIGIPGYPVSAYIVYKLFVAPVVRRAARENCESVQKVNATLTKRIVGSFKNAELVRMALGEVGGKLVATPRERGASQIMSLVKADGLFKLERKIEGVEAGEEIVCELLRPLDEIKKSLVIIGSHDMLIDVISDKIPVTSAHVGSMGGISSMLRGECHIAPIHLLDEKSGEYNIPYIKQYFPDKKMALIKGVGRVQGLIIKKGNPLGISEIDDVWKRKLSFANRQRGAGTRILFDYELQKHNVKAQDVLGYEKEYGTHLAVAVAVKNGVADCGLGVLSAAKALDLDFLPVGNEEYDFLVPYEFLEDDRVKEFIDVLKSDCFKDKLSELGGYSVKRTGEIEEIE